MVEAIGTLPITDLAHIQDSYLQRLNSLAKTLEQTISFEQFGLDGDIVQIRSGVPDTAKVEVAGNRIWRHYGTSESILTIKNSKNLVAGPVPYAEVSRGSRITWRDLTGVFLTTRDYAPDKIGVPSRQNHIDFYIEPELRMLFIRDGIWLIPNPTESRVRVPIRAI